MSYSYSFFEFSQRICYKEMNAFTNMNALTDMNAFTEMNAFTDMNAFTEKNAALHYERVHRSSERDERVQFTKMNVSERVHLQKLS